jgi:nucleoside-diphosphate-sugar epimerase
MFNFKSKIVLCGGAGLVGQNLVHILIESGYTNITVIDKHKRNLQILKNFYPEITTINNDLAIRGNWEDSLKDVNVLVMLQAQIGGENFLEFKNNNLNSTKNILRIVKEFQVDRLIHVSSSVVNSLADDFYSQTKRLQESLVIDSGIECVILRPTLMFGWFDRKHLGWLSRFLRKSPIFPIPGNGEYLRQPLYVKDFCKIIISCITHTNINGAFDISGLERINYIDIIYQIKRAVKSRALVIKIPYRLFYILIKIWTIFDKNPPFTVQQLEALIIKEEFNIIDWPKIFKVQSTSHSEAINETFTHPTFSHVKLDF